MPRLDFLANMNISPMTVKRLKEQGWNMIRIPEVMDPKCKDRDILRYAREHKKVLITQDLDFSFLLAVGGHRKPSVINLRLENAKPEYVATRLADVVGAMELEEGVVMTVEETSVRYRNLPIRTE